MKKILLLLLSVVLVFSLVACGNEENPDPSGSENPGVSQSGENNEDQGGENSTVNPEDIDFAANADFILICTYEADGANPGLVIYKKR